VGSVAAILIELAAGQLVEKLVVAAAERAVRRAVGDGGASAGRAALGPRVVPLPVAAAWTSTVRSHTPGRVRLHVPRMQGDTGSAALLAARLRRVPGVRNATAQPLTGTVLVEYDPEATSLARIRAALRGRRRAVRRPAVRVECLPKAV
jgi:hypothetical protein